MIRAEMDADRGMIPADRGMMESRERDRIEA